MNKKTLILFLIIIIFAGVIIFQYKELKNKNSKSIKINTGVSLNKSVVNNKPKVDSSKNVVVDENIPAKDREALKNSFTYEVPISKIIDRKWVWLKAINYDDSVFSPAKVDAFSLTFNKDGTFTGTTDCNSIFGKYIVENGNIKFSSTGQTKMFCDSSEEIKFTTYLSQVVGFKFNGEEDLVLNLEYDSGSMIFK
ncbi:MAG: META domain-containing protein [Candidatus Nomurabacteria bacterium]